MTDHDLAIAKSVGILQQENPREWAVNPLDEDPLMGVAAASAVSLVAITSVALLFAMVQYLGVL